MAFPPKTRLISSYKSFATYSSLFVILMGVLVMIGWALNIPFLKSVFLDLTTMKANTAFCFVLSGIALWLVNDEKAEDKKMWAVRACAALVTALGLLTLGEFIFRIDLGIDQLLFKDTETPQVAFPGRIGFPSAISFVLIGVSLSALTLRSGAANLLSQSVVLVAGTIGLLALIGYLYDVEALHGVGHSSHMALHSAVNFILLALGICCARPQMGLMRLLTADSVESEVVRRLLSVLFGMPIILGWLSLWGNV